MNEATTVAAGPVAPWLSLRLGENDFAIDARRVRELRRYSPLTPVPRAPSFMLGLLDIRGSLIPVLDLGLRLGLERVEAREHSIIVVINAPRGVIGLLVDEVNDLLSLPDEALRYPPSFSSNAKTGFVGGAIALDGKIINILRSENIADVEHAS